MEIKLLSKTCVVWPLVKYSIGILSKSRREKYQQHVVLSLCSCFVAMPACRCFHSTRNKTTLGRLQSVEVFARATPVAEFIVSIESSIACSISFDVVSLAGRLFFSFLGFFLRSCIGSRRLCVDHLVGLVVTVLGSVTELHAGEPQRVSA